MTRVFLRRSVVSLLALTVLAVLIAGCGASSTSPSSSASGGSTAAKFDVVAGENFWGSIAAQLAGDKASVQSIIVNPNADPHSYQPDAQDARTIAGAQLAIVNGIGYDEWMTQELNASPASGRVVLNVGGLLGLHEGDNPHQRYSPIHVNKVIEQITADYDKRHGLISDQRRVTSSKGRLQKVSLISARESLSYISNTHLPRKQAVDLVLNPRASGCVLDPCDQHLTRVTF